MVYWMNRDPATDVANAIAYLSQFGKPVFPIGQAYDGGPEGGPPGVPGREAIIRFMQYADGAGGDGRVVLELAARHARRCGTRCVMPPSSASRLGGANGDGLNPTMIRRTRRCSPASASPWRPTASWTPATTDAVKAYQAAARLPVDRPHRPGDPDVPPPPGRRPQTS